MARRSTGERHDDQPRKDDHRAHRRRLLDEMIRYGMQPNQEHNEDEHRKDSSSRSTGCQAPIEQPPSPEHEATVARLPMIVQWLRSRPALAEGDPG